MNEHWQRLAEAQRVKQEIEAEFRLALSLIGRDAAERIRRTTDLAHSHRRDGLVRA